GRQGGGGGRGVGVAGKTQEIGLDPVLVVTERGPVPDVHHRARAPAGEGRPRHVDAGGEQHRAVRTEVRGGEAKRAAPARAPQHGSADRIGMAQEAAGGGGVGGGRRVPASTLSGGRTWVTKPWRVPSDCSSAEVPRASRPNVWL